MSSGAREPARPSACTSCLRRRWLLSALSGPLEFCARDRGRLIELLALPDGELLEAVAGRRRTELKARYAQFEAGAPAGAQEPETICRHRRGYPRALCGPAAPHMLAVAGGVERLAKLVLAPVVAILGSRTASDYGMEIARCLARGLAASGVTVTAGLTDGIATAAHAGALDAGGASIAVLGGGLDVACPMRRRHLYRRLQRRGCAVGELPPGCTGRRWGQLASERIVVELAELVVLVEAELTPADLAAARLARARGRALAAVPGRVTSPLSRGTIALLMDGASLIRGPQDALEILYSIGVSRADAGPALTRARIPEPVDGLGGRLKAMLERVGSGCDTPDKLTRCGEDSAEVLLALSELELMGLLARGDGGRYVPRQPLVGGGRGREISAETVGPAARPEHQSFIE